MEGHPSSVGRQLRIPYRYNVIWNKSWYRRALKQRDGVGRSFDHGALLQREAVVKRAYVELRERAPYLKRLAFYTITEEEAAQFEWVHLTGSKPEDIDVVVTVDEVDLEAMRRALDCYVTYAATVEAHQDGTGIKRSISREAVFDIYQEAHDPPLNSLVEGLIENG